MILIIGGAYQGKLDFAKKSFGFREEDIFTCTPGKIDFSERCINKVQESIWRMEDPIGFFRANRAQWADSVMILDDVSCGVVPMGAENRAWRENVGRLMQYLAGEAEQVSRIFCGLELRLK